MSLPNLGNKTLRSTGG